jgi:hypothetical protein
VVARAARASSGMQIRVVRFHTRNPLVGALILALALALVVAVLAVGVTVGAGLAIVAGAVLLARRLLGRRAIPRPETTGARLDASREVFAPPPDDAAHRLPPGAA